jgi:asparagine synthase (glutamine-hydrolysing)
VCGLVGILRRDGEPADLRTIDRMLSPMLHRGPDGRGSWAEDEIALGHLRLSILDLSERASQPIATAGGEAVLVYNGEVYNHLALRAELEREGVVFASSGDTEVVLQALVRWGPERAIPRFNGMFAFAYFDRRTRELWLARDRLGIKPLYTAVQGGELLFASEPQALLAHPAMPCRPDRIAIATLVLSGRPSPRLSCFEGIESIEAGSWWRVRPSGIARHRYFHAHDDLDVTRLLEADTRDAVARFEDLFDESVRMHLASDVPLAAICSGGVDSSLIAAFASRHHKDLHCYVADVPAGRGEGDTAQRVADHLGVRLTRVPVDRESYLRHLPEVAWFEGQPVARRSNVALLALVQACRADGVKVLLNGEGSDELFGGYAGPADAYRSWGWRARLKRRFDTSRSRRRHELRRLQANRFLGIPGVEQLGPRGFAVIDGEGALRYAALREKLAPIRSDADRAFLLRCLDDLYVTLDPLLRRHDRMAMAASIEMRVPFVENGIIDFGMHLPRRAKLRRGQRKWVVKQAAEKLLPGEIVHARKLAFPIPDEFDAGCEALLAGGAAGELLRWTDRTRQAMVHAARHQAALRFSLLGLELWGRLYLRGEKPDALASELLSTSPAASSTSKQLPPPSRGR